MKSTHVSHFASLSRVAVGILLTAQFMISGGPQSQTPFDFSSTQRFLTHVSTDKPIYRPGERVFVRGVLLRAEGHAPVKLPNSSTASYEIKGPKGDTVDFGQASISDSIAAFAWDIPETQSGGEYAVRISHSGGDAPAERKFDIRAYRAPRLKSQIVFARDGYGPGDRVQASLNVERAEGGVPLHAKVGVRALVDGNEVWKGETTVDRSGNAEVSFKLPAAITRGEGVLAMTVQDGGITETAAKTIPILLQTLDLSIYPEGGDLVAGLPNRVYIEGRTPAQKPADIAGVVVNARGMEVARFRTEHEGRGRFAFVPARGERYSLRVIEPSGIKTVFPLPSVKPSGVVISSSADVTPRQEDIVVRVTSTDDGTYAVALSQRGREFAHKRLFLRSRQTEAVTLTVPKILDGVIVATVYDEGNTPMAERLVFRQPENNLHVKVTSDRADYVPGDKVTLQIATTDEHGKPVGAVVGLNVTDSSVLEMIDKREQAPRLPVMVLLENDVRNLADAHVYLDQTNPKAYLATDLLLGTQGWRRFASVDAAKFVATHNDDARRALAIKTGPVFELPGFPPVRLQDPMPSPLPPIISRVAAGTEHIMGAVVDQSMAFIPGVTITATNTDTGVAATAITDESGVYTFPRLNPGTYRVTAALPGFNTSAISGLRLAPATMARLNFVLQVAFVSTMVEVSVSADSILRTTSASVGEVLTSRTLINPDLVGEIRLILSPVDAELGRGNGAIRVGVLPGLMAGTVKVREYAHSPAPNRPDETRNDFSETVYWNAGVRTNASTGLASVTFNLSDSITSFRVLADAFTNDGALGSATSHVDSVQPFSLEPKMPLQVTSGDVIHLPVGLINGTNRELRDVDVRAKVSAGLKIDSIGEKREELQPGARARQVLEMDVAENFSGTIDLTIDGKAGRYRDSITRKLDVQPAGFPQETGTGGLLERNSVQSFEFTLPDEMVRGSAASTVTVYPTPTANLTEALKVLIREPHGCFEQTSATSYPMVMAQQYFLTHQGVDKAIIDRTRKLLDDAYKRLLTFQTASNGYEWFGADPGHEALTAYAVLQFTDMAEVRNVDPDMLARTRAWLLSRRDAKGGFRLNPNGYHSFGHTAADTVNAYIVWALVEAGETGLGKEIAAVKASAGNTQDSYVLALAANILHESGDKAGARELMARLARNQQAGGNVKGAVTSITNSGGESLVVETTALSVLAWLRESDYAAQADKGWRWIAASNRNGMFGTTQGTVLALRSIVAHDAANARPKAPGRLILKIDGKAVGTPLAFSENSQGELVLPELAHDLGPGRHTATLAMEDGSRMPFSINVKYHTKLPPSAEEAQVRVQVSLRDREVQEGGVTEATVTLSNRSSQTIPTPVAIIGIPGGLEVRHDQLKELVKSGKVDAYEVIGREVILYWRAMQGGYNMELLISLIAAVPGSYTGPASRAYLYYTPEYKSWAPGMAVDIRER